MKFDFTEKGIITFTSIIVCATLLMSGKDAVVGYVLMAVVVGYFGIIAIPQGIIQIQKGVKNGQKLHRPEDQPDNEDRADRRSRTLPKDRRSH